MPSPLRDAGPRPPQGPAHAPCAPATAALRLGRRFPRRLRGREKEREGGKGGGARAHWRAHPPSSPFPSGHAGRAVPASLPHGGLWGGWGVCEGRVKGVLRGRAEAVLPVEGGRRAAERSTGGRGLREVSDGDRPPSSSGAPRGRAAERGCCWAWDS